MGATPYPSRFPKPATKDALPPPYSLAPSTRAKEDTTKIDATPAPRNPIENYWHRSGIYGLNIRGALRALQFIFAVIVAGLYGVDLSHATSIHAHAHAEWIYAEFVAAFSGLTCIFHLLLTVTHVWWCAWDAVLFILWLAQVGVFGVLFYPGVKAGYEESTRSATQMRAAVWVSLINMILWLGTVSLGIRWCVGTRRWVRRRNDGEEGRIKKLFARSNGRDEENCYGPLERGCVEIEKELLPEEPKDMKVKKEKKECSDRKAEGDT